MVVVKNAENAENADCDGDGGYDGGVFLREMEVQSFQKYMKALA